MTLEDIQQIQHFEDFEKRSRLDNRAHREFRILMVPDRNKPEDETRFVVSFPQIYTAHSPFGRATRPMLAYDMEKGEIVFLKVLDTFTLAPNARWWGFSTPSPLLQMPDCGVLDVHTLALSLEQN